MIVQGTKKEIIDIEVNASEFAQDLFDLWKLSIGVPSGHYIRGSTGMWESSDSYLRKATEKEKFDHDAFCRVMSIASRLD